MNSEFQTLQAPYALVAQLRGSLVSADSRAQEVALQLETAIAVGLIGDGERLPPERQLATQLEATVLQVRQALATLREKGLVETSRGRSGGSVVHAANLLNEQAVRNDLHNHSTIRLRDIGDFSGMMLSTASRLAAARSNNSDVQRLLKLHQQFAASARPSDLRRTDSRFRIGIAAAAQSGRLVRAITQELGDLIPLLWGIPDDVFLESSVRLRLHLIEAIAAQNPEQAQRVAAELSAQETTRLLERHIQAVLTVDPDP